jgi:hypothetical protein
MPGIDRSDGVLDGEVLTDAGPACVELVPVTPALRWSPRPRLTHPDPSFVTHLIATAAQAPQTCHLRRASLADAQSAYGASRSQRPPTGFQARRVI